MRISFSLGSLLSVNEVLKCTEIIADTNAEAIWIPETWGMENFAMLGSISNKTKTQKLGSSIINIYSRSPAAIAMGAATVDALSDGRLILGLGTSSMPIIQTFHGYKFERPLQRMREYVEIIRLVLSGGKVCYTGKIFNLKDFSLLIKPQRAGIPIYLAAINQKMLELTWDVADGAIFYLRPKDEMRQTIPRMQQRQKIDVACQLITCVSENSDAAILRAKRTLSFYIAVGEIYREFLSDNGYKNQCSDILGEFEKSGLGSLHELIPDSMLKSLCIAGTPEECRTQLREFRETGIDLPILQFNPVGDTLDSFNLLKNTFLEQ